LDQFLIFPFVYQSDCHEALNEFLSRCDIAESSSLKLLEVFNIIMNTNRELLYRADVIWNTYNTLLDPVLKFQFIFQSDCHEALNEFHSRCDIADSTSLKLLELINVHKQKTLIWSWCFWKPYNTLLDPVLKFPFAYQSDCQALLNKLRSRCDIADSSWSNLLELVTYLTDSNRELLYEADEYLKY